MGNASQINRSRNSVRVERRSDLNESDLGEVYCSSKLGFFEQKRWPGKGSSPKTAGSQSVKCCFTPSSSIAGVHRTSYYQVLLLDCCFMLQVNAVMKAGRFSPTFPTPPQRRASLRSYTVSLNHQHRHLVL